MDPTVLAALITSTSSIIVALITTLGAQWLISPRERRTVSGPKPDGAEAAKTTISVKPPDTQQPVTPSKRKSKTLVIRILLPVVIGGIIGGVLGYSFIAVPVALSPCGLFAPTSVTITSPASDSKVSSQIIVQGAACHIPPGKELWLLVTVEGVSGYFPQGDATNPRPITVESDGTWSVAATIGTSADIGKTFTLIPALVDQNDSEAENAIHNFFKQSGPVYVGIQPLPSGIQLMSPISVIRT